MTDIFGATGTVAVMAVCSAFFLVSAGAAPENVNAAEPLAELVIGENVLTGYVAVKQPERYRPESLWNYINGGALPYLDYGVGDVVTFSGKLAPYDFEIVTDIYDMGSNRNAFGIYSSERFPDYNYTDIGEEGYITDNGVYFWKNRYYIKVFSNAPETPSTDPIERIARTVAERIPDGKGMPAVLTVFPDDGRIPKSESFIAKNVLGQDYLSNGFSVTYHFGDEEYQLYILEAGNINDAGDMFTRYRDFIKEYGKLERKKPNTGDEAFSGTEDWYGLVVFSRKGRYIAGCVGLPDYDLAVKHLTSMLDGLGN